MGIEGRTVNCDAITIAGVRLSRDDFGEGRLGEKAWALIKGKVHCGSVVGGKKCRKLATGTTDFDVLGDAEIVPHCSHTCHQNIMHVVEKDLAREGRTTVFGRNGFGRG